jgi:hypothetical protein
MTGPGLRLRRWAPFALTFATAAAVTGAALAGVGSRAQANDPNDTRGVLDVRRVWFDPEAAPPRWTVVTFAPWTPEQVRDRGVVFVFLDTMGSARSDYYAMVASTGHKLVGSLWQDPKRGPDVKIAGLDVRREGDLAVAVPIPLGRLDVGVFRTSYDWWVITTFTGRVCRATCVDRVPDDGAIEQPIGTTTPTATATPTGSPTP